MMGAVRYALSAVLFLTVACANAGSDASPTTTAIVMTTTSTAATSTTTLAPSTTEPVQTTVTTIPVDLINPLAGTLAGVQVGQGPVDPIIGAVTAVFGDPEQDSGWRPDPCIGGPPTRSVIWSSLAAYFEEADGAESLMGYSWDQTGQAGEPIELPEGIELGMPFSGAAALYPDGAYTHVSLELDGVILQETPMLAVVGQHTDDGSGAVDRVWVGAIPACS